MRHLMLLRHAKADWPLPEQRDHDRALSPRGQEAALKIGTWIAGHPYPPERVIVSTARRTRDTWALAAEAFAAPPTAVFDTRLYAAMPQTICAVIRETAPACRSLLVVAHNPGLQDTALLLAKDGDKDALSRLAARFPTAGLASIALPIEDWADLQPGAGRLVAFTSPRLLAGTA